MVAAILASVVARGVRPYSIYTEALKGRGIDLPWRMEEAVLAGLKVEDLCRPDPETLTPGTPYAEVVERFLATHRQRLYVVAPDGLLLGAVSLHDIKHVLDRPETVAGVLAHDLMAPVDRKLAVDERLHRAVEYFAHSDFERLPVVDEAGRFAGVVAKRDLLAVYAQEVLGRPAMLATFVSHQGSEANRQYVEIPPDFALRKVAVPADLVGKTLAEARLPQTLGVRVIEIRRQGKRGEEQVIPTAETLLEAGDFLVLLGPRTTVDPLADGADGADGGLPASGSA
jgi:CBS domain-containing protein